MKVCQCRRQLDFLSLYRVHPGPHFFCNTGVIAVSQGQRILISVDVIFISEPAVCSDILIAIRQETIIPCVSHIVANRRKSDSGCPVVIPTVLLQQVFPHVQVVSIIVHAGDRV